MPKRFSLAYEDATALIQDGSARLQGRLRVRVPVVFGTMFIVPWVTSFLAAHPKLELNLTFDDRYANLMDEELDVLIRVGVAIDSTLKARTLGHSVRRVVASPAYLAQAGTPSTAQDLSAHWVVRHNTALHGEPWVFRRGGQPIRVPVRARFFANNSQALVAAAKAGLGIALLARIGSSTRTSMTGA